MDGWKPLAEPLKAGVGNLNHSKSDLNPFSTEKKTGEPQNTFDI